MPLRYGIYLTGASSTADIFGNDIFGNATGIRCDNDADPLIGGTAENRNNIFDNTDFGVNNTSADITIDSTYNWWGAYTGPTDDGNPDGNGDSVSGNVDYSEYIPISSLKGDLDNDDKVDLADAVTGLQVIAGVNPSVFHPEYVFGGIDINGDDKAGLAEVAYDLRVTAGLNVE